MKSRKMEPRTEASVRTSVKSLAHCSPYKTPTARINQTRVKKRVRTENMLRKASTTSHMPRIVTPRGLGFLVKGQKTNCR